MGKIYTIINNGIQQKQIKNEFLESYLSNGWEVGKLYQPWNKGLTANEDERVLKNVNGLKNYYANLTPEQELEWREKIKNANLGKKWSIEAITKRTNSRKGFIPSQEQRERVSQKLKNHLVSQETREKISQANKGRAGKKWSDEQRAYFSQLHSSPEYQKRANETKRRNKTFNTSKPEQRAYKALKEMLGEDVKYSYRDIRYPYNCDFYIESMDLFIELNYLWTHGGEPFDETNVKHLEKLKIWQDKSEKSDFYKNAIYVWTKSDVKKRETAIKNKLNYLTFYKESDFNIWFENQATKWGEKYYAKIKTSEAKEL